MPKESYIERVRAKLKYEDTSLESVELTDDDIKRLSAWRPHDFKGLSKEEARKKLDTLLGEWQYAHCGSTSGTVDYREIEDIIFTKGFSRYDSSKYQPNNHDYEVAPLYRWMNISNENCRIKPNGDVDYKSSIKSVDSFIDEYFKVGGEFTALVHQCCSKNKKYAETYFHDDNSYMNIKMVIHPKGKLSKAADLHGNNEAVYQQGTKFKVIDRHIEEYVCPNYKESSDFNRVFSRWLVDLQEL